MVHATRATGKLRAIAATAALTASLGLVSALSPVAYAQDANATPTAITCEAPDLPPGTASPMDASPEAMAMDDMAMATPVPAEDLVGTPVDELRTASVVAAAFNVVACIQEDPSKGLALMSTNFLLEQFGTDNPYDVLAQQGLEGISFDDFTTGAVYSYEDGSVSVDVQYRGSAYQASGERWFFTDDGSGVMTLDHLVSITPVVDGDTTVVGVTLADYSFTFNVSSIVETEVLMFHVVNAGTEPHEMVIFRGSDDVTVDSVLADPETVLSNAEYVGSQFLPVPGDQADMALVGLEPGKYVVVCFIPSPDGTPHFMKGMIGEFEILGV